MVATTPILDTRVMVWLVSCRWFDTFRYCEVLTTHHHDGEYLMVSIRGRGDTTPTVMVSNITCDTPAWYADTTTLVGRSIVENLLGKEFVEDALQTMARALELQSSHEAYQLLHGSLH